MKEKTKERMKADYAADIPMDPALLDDAWQQTRKYPLHWLKPNGFESWPGEKQKNIGRRLREKASARLLWNETHLAVGVEMEDSDVVAEGTRDQDHLYLQGDTIEVFIKPLKANYYWELYGTPNNLKTVFFYPSRGYLFLPSCAKQKAEITVCTKVFGTLNDWRKRDMGWNMIMKIPLAMLTRHGLEFETGEWSIMIGRQNYSAFLPFKELSSVPKLSCPDFHLYEEYAIITLNDSKKTISQK
ncbi:MAG: hypothetical protein GX946_02525 [Oligosphaeraceae bacterium]|nr:hypothetical protein [Oligosphaeraceae bacterium]